MFKKILLITVLSFASITAFAFDECFGDYSRQRVESSAISYISEEFNWEEQDLADSVVDVVVNDQLTITNFDVELYFENEKYVILEFVGTCPQKIQQSNL